MLRFKKQSIFLFLFSVYSSALFASFGELTVQTQTLPNNGMDIRVGKKAPRKIRCSKIFFTVPTTHLLKFSMGKGQDLPRQDHLPDDVIIQTAGTQKIHEASPSRPSKVQQRFFEEAMNQWGDHGYNARQVDFLRRLNDQLPSHRVHWISFKFNQELWVENMPIPPELQGLASIRIFDGSTPLTKVVGLPRRYKKEKDWKDPKNLVESLTPIELSPKNKAAGYKLPQRLKNDGKPVFLWHLGIGTNVKRFEGGLKVMFSHVAELLEMHYNQSFFKTFGSAKVLDDLNMMVVSSAKPELVEYYKKLGFEVLKAYPEGKKQEEIFEVDSQGVAKKTFADLQSVIEVNSKGEARVQETDKGVLPDGMVLIGMPASKFVKKYYGMQDVPYIEIITPDVEYRLGRQDLSGEAKGDEMWVSQNRLLAREARSLGLLSGPTEIAKKIDELNYLFNRYAFAVKQFVESTPDVYRLYEAEYKVFANNPKYQELIEVYREFAEAYYMLMRRIPKSYRSHEWALLEKQGLSQLVDHPLEAYENYRPEDINPSTGRMGFIESFYFGLQ